MLQLILVIQALVTLFIIEIRLVIRRFTKVAISFFTALTMQEKDIYMNLYQLRLTIQILL